MESSSLVSILSDQTWAATIVFPARISWGNRTRPRQIMQHRRSLALKAETMTEVYTDCTTTMLVIYFADAPPCSKWPSCKEVTSSTSRQPKAFRALHWEYQSHSLMMLISVLMSCVASSTNLSENHSIMDLKE